MKRSHLAVVAILLVFIFISVPVSEQPSSPLSPPSSQSDAGTDLEQQQQQEQQFPRGNSFSVSTDGDVSDASITSFSETVEDDVMRTLDYKDTLESYETSGEIAYFSGTISDTHVTDGAYLQFYEPSNSHGTDFIILNVSATEPMAETLQMYIYSRLGYTGNDTHYYLYNYDTASWDLIYSQDTSDGTFHYYSFDLGTTYLWNDEPVRLKLMHETCPLDLQTWDVRVDYIAVVNDVSGDNGDKYVESFADVSDWTTAGVYGEIWSTDGDVGNLTSTASGTIIYPQVYTDDPSVPAGSYGEIRFYLSAATWVAVEVWSNDGRTGDRDTIAYATYGAGWRTVKSHLTYAVESIRILFAWSTAETRTMLIDYICIAPAAYFGWQHDCSTISGLTLTGDASVTSDGDMLNITNDASTQNSEFVEFHIDLTTTKAAISMSYYPFFEIKIDNVGDGNKDGYVWLLRAYTTSGSYANLWGYTAETGVFRYYVRATFNDISYFRLYVNRPGDWVKIDYLNLYSIANFTVSDNGLPTTDDVLYVENGVLYSEIDDGYFVLNRDPATSFDSSVYNVVNFTMTYQDVYYDYCKFIYTDGKYSGAITFYRGTTYTAGKGPVTRDFYFTIRTSYFISKIEFWSDHTAPNIEEKWNSPTDPTTADNISLFIVLTDTVGAYTVTFTPLSQPSASSITTIPLSLVDRKSESGAEFWLGFTMLVEGFYVFEVDAFDGANHGYAYLAFSVSAERRFTYIRIFDSLGQYIDFETFEVYVNNSRQYTDAFLADTTAHYTVTVKDRWGQTLNETTFAWSPEFVVIVDVYSFKVMSWADDFVYFNLTHSGLTFTQVIAPLETVEYRLWGGDYDWAVDYRNGTSLSGSLTLTNSTALVITGNTIADVAGLSASILNMTHEINLTVYATYDQTVTIMLNLTNVNSTIFNQTIAILLNIQNSNSTIYNQTVSLLSAITNVNSTIYGQTVQILADISNVNSTLYSQTVSILSHIENVNSTLYSQTLQILSDVANTNSTLYAQTVTLLADIQNTNATLYNQTITLLTEIQNTNSTLYSQTIEILSDLTNVNSTLYGQTITILTRLANVNSTLYSQGIDVLTYIYNTNSTLYTQTISILSQIDDNEQLSRQIKTLSQNIRNEIPDSADIAQRIKPFIEWDTLIVFFGLAVVVLFIALVIRAIRNDHRQGRIAKSAQLDPIKYIE